MKRRHLLVALGVAACARAHAQATIYRCGADGRTFSQTPCRDGLALEIRPGPSTQEHQAARDVAQREAELAQRLGEERLARDGAAARLRAPAAAIGAPRADDEVAATAPPPRDSRRTRVPRDAASRTTKGSGR